MAWTVEAQQLNNLNNAYGQRRRNLTEVPSNIPAPSVLIDLEWNQITVIKTNSFLNNSVCEDLLLSYNKIHTIESGAWTGLSSLKVLRLWNNEISVIRHNSFTHLSVLLGLSLKRNTIHSMEDGAWHGLDSLQWLHLDHNEIEVLWNSRRLISSQRHAV